MSLKFEWWAAFNDTRAFTRLSKQLTPSWHFIDFGGKWKKKTEKKKQWKATCERKVKTKQGHWFKGRLVLQSAIRLCKQLLFKECAHIVERVVDGGLWMLCWSVLAVVLCVYGNISVKLSMDYFAWNTIVIGFDLIMLHEKVNL